MRRWVGLSSIAVFGLVACGDDSSCPTCPQTTFSFRITVRDAGGNPVPGLRTSLLYAPLAGFPGAATPRVQALHPTTVRFVSPDSADVTLDVLDFERRSVGQPVVSNRVLPGAHEVALAPEAPYGVYWIRLVARRAETIVFRDSILAAWWPIDPATNVLGTTDADGVLQTQDALRFPNVLELPPLVRMTATGDSAGTFSYPDTVSLVLSDPPGSPVQRLSVYRLVVGPGGNDFRLTWPNTAIVDASIRGPVAGAPRSDTGVEGAPRARDLDEPPIVAPPSAWRLYQNFPNPVD